jgi:hypothetical protein
LNSASSSTQTSLLLVSIIPINGLSI